LEMITGPSCYYTGEKIVGRVVLDQKEDFKGTDLVITIIGTEVTNLKKIGEDFGQSPTDSQQFFHGQVVLHKFENHISPKGRNEYEFEIRVPEWLPACSIHNSEYAIYLKTSYEIIAQVMPAVQSDNQLKGFKDSRPIYIFSKPKGVPRVDVKDQISTKVGGLMGLGAKVSVMDVKLDQNQYYNGDVCRVNVVCDNSASSVDVKSFKLKLKRKVFA